MAVSVLFFSSLPVEKGNLGSLCVNDLNHPLASQKDRLSKLSMYVKSRFLVGHFFNPLLFFTGFT